VWRCHPILSIISARVAPFLRCSIATTWAVLLPSRGPDSAFAGFAAFLALGAFLAEAVFLVALVLADAPLAACAPALRFLSALGFVGSALAGSARPWIRSQIRTTAVFASFSFLTGCSESLSGAPPARTQPIPPAPAGY
jgi:hypothetical protein